MTYLITPNMNLTNPLVGTETGPQYATDIYNSLNLVDTHNHTPGHGVQIPAAGINLQSDLTFNTHAATNLMMTQFTSQSAPLDSSVVGALYEVGNELYFNDGAGNQVQLTSGGSIVGTAGSITGLPSGTAGVSYSSPTYTFQSSTNTAGNIDAGSITIRQVLSGANGITIKSPTSLAGNYSLTLPPALPATPSLSLLSLDSSGVISIFASNPTVNGLTVVGGGLAVNSGGLTVNSGTTALLNTNIFGTVDISGATIFETTLQIGSVGGPVLSQSGSNLSITGGIQFTSGGPILSLSSGTTLNIIDSLQINGGPVLSSNSVGLVSSGGSAGLFYPNGTSKVSLSGWATNGLGIRSAGSGDHVFSAVVGGTQDNSSTPLLVVAGGFNSSGTGLIGYGFTVAHTANSGVYTVSTTGANWGDSTPIAVATPSGGAVHFFVSTSAVSNNSVTFATFNSALSPTDVALDFIIIALRGA